MEKIREAERARLTIAIARAERLIVEADAFEQIGDHVLSRVFARQAGWWYQEAAYEAIRPAGGVDDGTPERTAHWRLGGRFMRLSAIAYLRGLSRRKAEERTALARNWEDTRISRGEGLRR